MKSLTGCGPYTTRQGQGMPEIIIKCEGQKVAEAEVESFRSDLGPFVVAAESTRMPMLFMDAKERGDPIIFVNDAFLDLSGYDREEVLGQSLNFLMARGTDPDAQARINAAFAGTTKGEIVQHFASLVDLTDHKQEEAQSRMLIDELNHRVKNTLATVQSIVWQALRNTADPNVIRESIEARLFALSRSHDLLTRENWEGAGLFDLIKAALEPFGVANGRSEHFVITGRNIRVSPKVTLALGIAFHELATNAVKYGAFSNKAGSVLISWMTEPSSEGNRLLLRWQEKNGPPVTPPSRKGFGSRVLERGLPHELEGTVHLDYRADGLICTINFPAPQGS
jgi:two-component sensor histidine kinase